MSDKPKVLWAARVFGDPYGPFFFKGTKNKPFTFKFYARNYAVIPILMIVFCDLCWMSFSVIQGFIRTDVVVANKFRKEHDMFELLLEPRQRKYFTFAQTYPIRKQTYDTYMLMRCMEKKRKRDCSKEIPPEPCKEESDDTCDSD
ncbi:unnamed protein product [Phyllotreta striolata]|uniref:Uncharacterized protein n=1 Tax=Phyllotreta striolata TaxID=444603 RepID=A0A9N9XQP7_PHYSR|nr:unnamed protein product [Phyllotreta striolata]